MVHHLSHLDELRVTGSKARAALEARGRIALRQAELVRDVLNGKRPVASPRVGLEDHCA
jgi:hypothetical protein